MKKYDTIKLIIIFIMALILAIVLQKFNIGIPCIFHQVTGLYCPGCGTTRAITSLIRLQPYQAFRYNILIVSLLPITCIYLLYRYVLKERQKIPNIIWYFLLVLVISFGILRNIPFFSYLAPTNL